VGFYTLDDFFGPLNLNAQTGAVDQLTFDESSSYVHDSVRLSSTQLVRYSQPPTVTVDPNPRVESHTETAYPFVVNFQTLGGSLSTLGGSFSPGVVFDTSYGGTDLYIPQTGANEPVTVNGYGVIAPDQIDVGFDGANDQNATTVEGVPVNSPFPATAAQSTLDQLTSTLQVYAPSGDAMLNVDDEAALGAESYTLRVLYPPAIPAGVLTRTNAAAITYGSGIHFALNAGGHGNSIAVMGVLTGTTASINAGAGSDTITVGNSLGDLNDIGGLLTIDGGAGTNSLTIQDTGDGFGEDYQLNASQFYRSANSRSVPAITIDFSRMSDVKFDASDNSGVNDIVVGGTPTGVPVSIDSGTGAADLAVDDLDELRGPLTFDFTPGTRSLSINDETASANATYDVANTGATLLTFPFTTVQRTGAALIKLLGELSSLYLAPGQLQNNTVNVDGIAAGTSAVIRTG